MALAKGQITIIDMLDGEAGDPGPAGTPGYLGLLVSGTTLSLKGYDADGILQAIEGYIYIDGQRIPIPQYSQDLSGNYGRGYIIFDVPANTIRFVKLIPTETVVFKDYSNPGTVVSGTYVIGQFDKSGSTIYDTKILTPPQTKDSFIISNFMEIMRAEDWSSFATWSQAMGITQMWQSIAVLEAFVNNLTANKVKSPNYTEDANGVPTQGFFLDAITNIIKAYGAKFYNLDVFGGTFNGSLVHDSLVTVKSAPGDPITLPSKTHWNTDDLCSALSGVPENTPTSIWSNSPMGSTVNIARLYNKYFTSADPYQHTLLDCVVPFSGTVTYSHELMDLYGDPRSFVDLYKNGTRVWGVASSGYDMETWSYSFSVETGDSIEAVLFIDGYPGGACGPVNAKFTMVAPYDVSGNYSYVTDWHYKLTSIFRKSTYRLTALSFSSPVSFNSANVIKYADVASILTALAALPDNSLVECNPGVTYLINHNGLNKTLVSLSKNASSVTLNFSDYPSLVMLKATPLEGSLYGGVNISGSFTPAADVDSIKSKTLIPFTDSTSDSTEGGTDIGTGAKRIRNINMAGNIVGTKNISPESVNSAGTSNLVYGAVFN